MTDTGRTEPFARHDPPVEPRADVPPDRDALDRDALDRDALDRDAVGHQRIDPEYGDQYVEPEPVSRPLRDDRPRRETRDPVEAAKDPTNRAKLLLAATALALLNLILLLVVLVNVLDDGPEQVIVDGVPCVIGEQDGTDILYCQR